MLAYHVRCSSIRENDLMETCSKLRGILEISESQSGLLQPVSGAEHQDKDALAKLRGEQHSWAALAYVSAWKRVFFQGFMHSGIQEIT